MTGAPILVFDSGLGGLTVFAEIEKLKLGRPLVYAADTAAFPYGALSDAAITARVGEVVGRLLATLRPCVVVIACNTASTLVLAPLRAQHAVPFVGTVPAIKPAAQRTGSKLFSVLATPGTVARDYTALLIREFAADCEVTLVGSARLAPIAEALMRGEGVDDTDIAREIAPAFVERDGRRTDAVVLGCTHYPLLLSRLEALAPWPVAWIDPAPAIARRVREVTGSIGDPPAGALPAPVALITSDVPGLQAVFCRAGFADMRVFPLPFTPPI